MFLMSTVHSPQGHFEGNILDICAQYVGLIFVGAADCEITFQFGQDQSH